MLITRTRHDSRFITTGSFLLLFVLTETVFLMVRHRQLWEAWSIADLTRATWLLKVWVQAHIFLWADVFFVIGLGILGARSRSKRPSAMATTFALAPRAKLLRTIERIVRHNEEAPYSILLIDIDGFKLTNDCYGSDAADILLEQVANRLRQFLPTNIQYDRFGSDEYLCFLPMVGSLEVPNMAQIVARAISEKPFSILGKPLIVTASIGFASYPDTGDTLRDCISQATSALHEAKTLGRNMTLGARTNVPGIYHLGAQVESALADGRLRPAYQPIVDLRTRLVVAEEGLARIVLPDNTILGADRFIDAATELHLTSRIDGCLIEQALSRGRQLALQDDRRMQFINVSAELLRDRRLIEYIAELINECDVLKHLTGARSPFVVEITERELLREPKAAVAALQPLLDLGVRLAIDDFGSGYSSFLYLTSLPVSFLKIEMELLQTARSSERARAILRGICGIAADLNIRTVAEGIEDEALAHLASDLGLHWGQGYFFGRPTLEGPARTPCRLLKRT